MKYKFLYLLFMTLLLSCNNNKSYDAVDNGYYELYGYSQIITINSHEYITLDRGIAHLPTCKKCLHERDSIVNLIILKLDSIKKYE